MNEMFKDYLQLKVLKTKWLAKEIEFWDFEIDIKDFCYKYDMNIDFVILSLELHPR
ncbi:hypothetical protein vBBcePLY3_00030 [Bacillus phage vB_BceP_LY3]|uniref:Uncharacterized protein n=1 Tax=Bacillus phage vB_BceP_LY3 TaxID=2950458 RepID=A0AAE9S211_9CAUD|nr:hypothetical protein vBBcePLY3_00030 [Bacillus phage vB_BceP_LY3]